MTTNNNQDNYINIAVDYYGAMLKQEFETMAGYLHPDVLFIGPLVEMAGKEPVTEAAMGLSKMLNNIDINAKFQSGNQVMLAYNFSFPEPIGKLRASVLMDFQDNLISRIELFYDARPFEEKKDEIFKK